MEFILHALAGCLTTTLVYHAAVLDTLSKPVPVEVVIEKARTGRAAFAKVSDL